MEFLSWRTAFLGASCSLHVLVKVSGGNLGQFPTLRNFASAGSAFSAPGRVEAEAARALFEFANIGVFAPLIIPE
jgi:hypothetical protein